MKPAVSLLVAATVSCFAAGPSFAQGDDADKKTIKRLVPEMDLVPSLYARGEEPVNAKKLPKFSATKLFGYPINKKETVDAERGFWKASKEIYAKSNPLRAAIFEAMDETDKLKEVEISMTIPGPVLTPKDKAAFLKKQEHLGVTIFKLQKTYQQMRDAAEKRAQENSNRWKANFELATTRMQGNLIFLYEFNYTFGQIRADNLPELGKDHDGWKIKFMPKINITEPTAKTYAKDRATLLNKIQEEHAGTPWAYFAERDSKRDMGMTWEPKKK
jgi:hypothetical protein